MTRPHRKPRIKDERSVPSPGTRVRVRLGSHTFEGEVVEDRGDIGAGGRRLLRVAVEFDAGATIEEYELPADQIKRV